jgi:hypothetical protein
VRPVLPGAPFGHLDVTTTGQRFDLHEQRGHPVAQ